MNKKLAKVIMMSLLFASVLPSVGEAASEYSVFNTDVNGKVSFLIQDLSTDGDINLNEKMIDLGTATSDDKDVEVNILGNSYINNTTKYMNVVIEQGGKVGIDSNFESTYDNMFTFKGDYLRIQGTGNQDLFLAVDNNRNLIFDNDVEFVINGAGGINNSGTLTFNKNLDITTLSDPDMRAVILNDGTMNIKGESFLVAAQKADGSFGEAISNKKILNINSTKVLIHGDIAHGDNANTNIVLNENSGIVGNIYNTDTNFNLTMKQGSTWMIPKTQDTAIYGLDFQGGAIFLYNNINAPYKEINFQGAKINSNMGYGQGFYLRTDLANDKGDCIDLYTVTDDTAMNVPVVLMEKQEQNGIPIKPEDNHSVTIAKTNILSNLNVEASYYGSDHKIYKPVIEEVVIDGKSAYLEHNFVGWSHTDDLGNDFGERDDIPTFPDEPHILVEDIEPIFKRLNDLRTDPSEVGVWMRGETGETKIRSYSYDHNIMSGGYDWETKNDKGILFTGVSFTYSTNDCDDSIVGDTKSYGVNAYGSWLGKENNDYVDLVVKYGKLDKDYAGYDRNNIFCSGDYDKDLFTVSAKYGRRIFRDDWYWEPSVGLAWGRVGSASFVDNHGLNIHADSTNSLITSLGMQVGKNIKGIEYYGKAEVMHDFDGKIHVSAPGRSVEDDMGGTWVKCAIGASRKIDENNSFYLEVERDFGNKVEKPYGFSAGYRFTW